MIRPLLIFITITTSFMIAGASAETRSEPMSSMGKTLHIKNLLTIVKETNETTSLVNRSRIERFKKNKNQQEKLLIEARQEKLSLEEKVRRLESEFSKNSAKINGSEAQLHEKMGELTEIYGHITTTANKVLAIFKNSIASHHYPERIMKIEGLLDKISQTDKVPDAADIKALWFEMTRELAEQGRVVEFKANVIAPNGISSTKKVIRFGTFNMVDEEGKYLKLTSAGEIVELARQPKSQVQINAASFFINNSNNYHSIALDPTGPSGGPYLSALVNSPTLKEKWKEGGIVGIFITCLGLFALSLSLVKIAWLSRTSMRVKRQISLYEREGIIDHSNPLGRVLHEKSQLLRNTSIDAFELKVSEAVIMEIPKITFGNSLVKLISGIAPLLGLLGTVVGMIITFQAITIHGAGDPQAMAGGISSALVTTVLGLVVAIPTLFFSTLINSMSKSIVDILEGQAQGIIAEEYLSDHDE